MYTAQYMVEEPISLSFVFPILVQLTLQHSQAQPYRLCTYLPNSSTFIWGATHREAVSTIFKVFGMARPELIRALDLPDSERTLCPYTIELIKHLKFKSNIPIKK